MSELGEYMRYMMANQGYLREMLRYQRAFVDSLHHDDVTQLIAMRFPFAQQSRRPTVIEAKQQLKDFLDRFPICRSDSLDKILNRVQIYIQLFPDDIARYLRDQ